MFNPPDLRSPLAAQRGTQSLPSTIQPAAVSSASPASIDLDAGLCLTPSATTKRFGQLFHLLLLLGIACLPACAEHESPAANRAAPRPIQTITLSSPGTVTPSTAPADDSQVVIIPNASGRVVVSNARCPIMPEHTIKPTGVFADQVAVFQGQLIGFCCSDCRDAWKSMSDTERQEALNLAANFK